MKQSITSLAWQLTIAMLLHLNGFANNPKIDSIKFTLTTNATNVALNEEFEIKITAEYINVSPNTAYVLKDANHFKIKLTLPEGFIKTSGDYHDYIGAELNASRPKVTYGGLKAGSIVTYPDSGVERQFRKLSDGNTSDWVATVWSTGISSKLP